MSILGMVAEQWQEFFASNSAIWLFSFFLRLFHPLHKSKHAGGKMQGALIPRGNMGFNEEIEREANKFRYGKKMYSERAIDKAVSIMKDRNAAGRFNPAYSWTDVVCEFIDVIHANSPKKSRVYRSGKRG